MEAFTFRRGQHAEHTFFVLLHTAAPPEAEGWNAYLDALRRTLPERIGRTHVFVATDGGGPNPAQRRSLATVFAERDALTHVFTTDLLVRGIVNAFRWMGGSAIAYQPREFPRVCPVVGHSPTAVLSLLDSAQSELKSVAILAQLHAALASEPPELDAGVMANRRR